MANNGIITALDLGSAKVCAIVAERGPSGTLRIAGWGTAISEGVVKGVVVDIAAAGRAIAEAVGKAAAKAGKEPGAAHVGVTGSHVGSLNNSGGVVIDRTDHEVRPEDVDRALAAARAVPLPDGSQVIHVIARSFRVDGQAGILHPVGMSCSRLRVDAHIIHASASAIENVERAAAAGGLEMAQAVLEPLATAESVLLPDERKMGVCLVDIGGGTSDIALFAEGTIEHSAVLPIGGGHVTGDLAYGLRTSRADAEKLKIECASAIQAEDDSTVPVMRLGGAEPAQIPLSDVMAIVRPRVEELFELVRDQIRASTGAGRLGAGVVLTGGGSLLRGCREVAAEVLEMPVRMASPDGALPAELRHPSFATAVGLLEFAAAEEPPPRVLARAVRHPALVKAAEWLQRTFGTG